MRLLEDSFTEITNAWGYCYPSKIAIPSTKVGEGKGEDTESVNERALLFSHFYSHRA